MNRRLPSLNAMRAFEAAARHLSFTKAAEELNVTQAAVSHQVKALEDQIGILLFQRRNRQLILTDAGQTLLPDLIDAFDAMDAAVTRVKRRDQSGILMVATMDSLAATWLMPRLARFREENPDIDIRLATSDLSVDYDRGGIDIGIRYGRGNWPGLVAEELMREDIFPVCAPELIGKGPGLRQPADLRHFPLIHDDMTEDWAMWLKAAGLTDIDPQRGTGFTHSNLVIQAAINGEGVALGRGLLVADSIAAGKLVAPFDLLLTAEYRYFVASTENNYDRPKVKVFRDWLFREARKTADTLTAEKRAWEKKA